MIPALFDPLITQLSFIFGILNKTAAWWLPFALGYLAWWLWMDYKLTEYIGGLNWKLLEVRLPKDVFKSPLAMEIVLGSFHQTSAGNWWEQSLTGRVKVWFSLELVSFEGNIHFFIRTPAKFKNLIEAQIYSQYPGVEIYEAEDYTRTVNYYPGSRWSIWGGEFALSKPDAYPIKTYVDYGLDKPDLKEEFRIDPIAPVIEFLGSLGKGEQAWIQIPVMAAGEKSFPHPPIRAGRGDWKADAKAVEAKILGERKFNELSKSEQEALAAIQRSTGKLGFYCGMRAIYLGDEGYFDGSKIAGLIGVIKQFSSEALNGFFPGWDTSFDFPWQDYNNIRLDKKKKDVFEAYKRRSYFYPPFKRKSFVLSSEELATIYHFPGRVSEAPGFTRIESRKVEPPANLPI